MQTSQQWQRNGKNTPQKEESFQSAKSENKRKEKMKKKSESVAYTFCGKTLEKELKKIRKPSIWKRLLNRFKSFLHDLEDEF